MPEPGVLMDMHAMFHLSPNQYKRLILNRFIALFGDLGRRSSAQRAGYVVQRSKMLDFAAKRNMGLGGRMAGLEDHPGRPVRPLAVLVPL
jgi:hypothetical protein